LRNDLGLKGPKFGCGLEQCGACKVLVDGQAVPSCRLPVKNVAGLPVTTIEGLGTADHLHPLQATFVAEQAIQCGYCASGMIIAAQGLLNRIRYPTDDDIGAALADNLCRCGVYDRVRRAIKLRIGQPADAPIYSVRLYAVRLYAVRPYGVRVTESEATAAVPTTELPHVLQETPDLDAWIRINSDETVTLFTGKVEYGQGLKTAVAQIGAEELDVSLARIRVVMADTAQTPDEGMTVGSMSLETTGNALRWAAAEARHRLLAIAYEELEVPLERLVVADGLISDPVTGRSVTYWDLFDGQKFACQVTGAVPPKRPAAHTLVGQPAQRLDLPAKVTGAATFVHDLDLPGMVHGRVVRPPHARARLLSVAAAAVAHMPGVLKVVQDGSFLAVIAGREEQAIQASVALRESAVWQGEAGLAPPETLYEHLFSQPDQPFLVVAGVVVDDPMPAIVTPPAAAHTLSATYSRPYQMHAALGPSAAVAWLAGGKLTLWVHSQGVFPPRAAIAHVLGLAEEDIHVMHRDGSGCYGHNGADDVILDAALLARALPEVPISLKWMRADEHGWEPYAPAMRVQMQASLNAAGEVIDWNHDVWSPTHLGRPRSGQGISGLLAAWSLAQSFDPPPVIPSRGPHSGSHRNADPLYAFARRRIVKHHLPHSPLRTSAMRGLGAFANVFAIESFMDELAQAAGADPVAFRLRHLVDERARTVIEAAAEKAGWQAGQESWGNGRGRGMAFAQYKNRQAYAAVVVDLRVDAASGRIHLERAVIAADAGQIINPDGLSNQLEGGFVQAASQTLREQVLWDQHGIVSLDWDTYPILRFPDAPRMETVLLNRPDQPHVGAGEAAQGPTPAAIANAVFAAIGVRLRQIPFTPERVKQALLLYNNRE
jgi:CO/xanthine dehydrogenase Mo-binding subunit/aerobic-type carbon monoxide dehydrogenase small subunit (CoxS/CutS family)